VPIKNITIKQLINKTSKIFIIRPKVNKISVSNKINTSINKTNWIENLCLILPVVKKPASNVALLFIKEVFIFNKKGTAYNKKHKNIIKIIINL
jgi:pyruvate/2-oxoglutarate/acetoin dehydrogenase E1 component